MTSPPAVCVFCGSNPGNDSYMALATSVGGALAQAGHAIVYGAGAGGLMRALADGALAAGGSVVGVVPVLFPDGEVHRNLTELHIVPGMHERKAMMASLAQAFVVLPGGLGTLD